MKTFSQASVQYTTVDPETEELYRVTFGDVVEDADPAVLQNIGAALGEIVDGELTGTKLTQTYEIA